MEPSVLTIIYLVASVTFLLGLKMLSHPETARKGNLVAAAGMTLAIFGTIFIYQDRYTQERLHNYGWIFTALLIGGIVGTLAARKVKMTAMPEMVSLFNGMGGACAALISMIEFDHFSRGNFIISVADPSDPSVLGEGLPVHPGMLITIFLGLIIGSISFAGSMVAWGKLNGKVKDFSFKGQQLANIVLLAAILGLAAFIITQIHTLNGGDPGLAGDATRAAYDSWIKYAFYGVFVLSLLYGLLFVFPIGGADMPVVISLLNSFTGVAAACGGFLYEIGR